MSDLINEENLPDKLYIEEKIGSNGYNCIDYLNYRDQIAYTPEILTRKDERERVIKIVEKYINPLKLTSIRHHYQFKDLIDKLNQLKGAVMNKQSIFSMYVGKCKVLHQDSEFPDGSNNGIKSLDGILGNDVFLDSESDNSYFISDCQLILKPLSIMSEEDKNVLRIEIPMEFEDLDILTGGIMHLATLENMVAIIFWLTQHGYALDDKWFKEGVCVEG